MHVVTFSTSAYTRMQFFVHEQFDSICAEARARALSFFRQLRLPDGDVDYFRHFAASIVSYFPHSERVYLIYFPFSRKKFSIPPNAVVICIFGA